MSLLPSSNDSSWSRTEGSGAEHAAQARNFSAPHRKTCRWFLSAGGLVVLLALAFWGPLQRKCTVYFLLQAEAPRQEVLSEAVDQAGDPASLLKKLWHSQRLPHRQFVLNYLNRVSSSRPTLSRELEPLVLGATADPDVEVRQLGFATLRRLKHPQLRRLALVQLSDADPSVRLIGLQSLRSIATSNDVSIAVGFLKDPEPRVVVAAAMLLRQITGQDFGIKSADALPQFTCIDTNPPPAPDFQAIQQGVGRWQEWWNLHHSRYQPPPQLSLPGDAAVSLKTPEFTLEDSGGKTVRLSQFLGKNVLLAFWSPGAPASLDDAPALRTLQERNSERLVLLGICLPAVPDCADEHGSGVRTGEEHAPHQHHHECCATPQDAAQFRALAQQTSDRLKINFPMLVDPESIIGSRFSASDLPLYVLIDAHGMVRRRFVGFRTEQALAAMVADAASKGGEEHLIKN